MRNRRNECWLSYQGLSQNQVWSKQKTSSRLVTLTSYLFTYTYYQELDEDLIRYQLWRGELVYWRSTTRLIKDRERERIRSFTKRDVMFILSLHYIVYCSVYIICIVKSHISWSKDRETILYDNGLCSYLYISNQDRWRCRCQLTLMTIIAYKSNLG